MGRPISPSLPDRLHQSLCSAVALVIRFPHRHKCFDPSSQQHCSELVLLFRAAWLLLERLLLLSLPPPWLLPVARSTPLRSLAVGRSLSRSVPLFQSKW